MKLIVILLYGCLNSMSAYWDIGTTTPNSKDWRTDVLRTSRFRWQKSAHYWLKLFYPSWNWYDLDFRRKLYVVAGISYKTINLGTAAILNRRTLLTAANVVDPYMNDAATMRVWALGRSGYHNTPWRYRVWRLTRIKPRSLNPEHCHGPYCYHTPRHDVCIIHTRDQMYLYYAISSTGHYATRTFITPKYETLTQELYFAGSGFEYHEHIAENYKIFYATTEIDQIQDCSFYLPKWWGKFICVNNHHHFPGVQNGGPLFNGVLLVGVGCYAHTYNDRSVLVFTDLRYYTEWIYRLAVIEVGEYYEYAYPQWAEYGNYIPEWVKQDDMYPLGK